MALIQCAECKEKVSSTASVCPHCGSKVKKPKSNRQWIVAGVALLVVGGFVSQKNDDIQAEKAAIEAQKTPEQKIAEEKEKLKAEIKKKKDDAEVQRVASYVTVLKKHMKNPDSFNLTSAILMADGSICYEYRATNSFNAVVPEVFVVTKTTASQKASDWNKFCAGKSGTDYTHIKHFL